MTPEGGQSFAKARRDAGGQANVLSRDDSPQGTADKAGGSHILIIDDSPEDRRAYKRLLDRGCAGGYVVSEAGTAKGGMELCVRESPDCILLDYHLPDLDGLELLAKLSDGGAHAPVIMLTGQGSEPVAVEALKRGAQDYLVKDKLTPEGLERAITHAIENADLHLQLAEQREEMARFAFAAAHDLKAPLRRMAQFAQLLERASNGALGEKAKQYLSFVVNNAEQLGGLVDDLLAFARAGREERDAIVVDLNAMALQAKTNLEIVINENDAQIQIGDLPSILGHKTDFLLLFQNLMANAVKFRGDNPPTVTVSAHRGDEIWNVEVRDNGIGIATEDQKRIFAPLTRLHSESEYTGSGIGLATCKKIVERNGGQIGVTSSPGCGSSFHFTLPT